MYFYNLLHCVSKLKKFFKKQTIQVIEFSLSQHCNLNCIGCCHFSPLAEEEFLDIETFTNDIKRLSKITKGRVEKINLLGGEPLLNPDVLKFLPVARKYFPKTFIEIVTNGILLKDQKEDFWKTCKKYNISVAVTKYPIKVDYDEFPKIAEYYGTKFRIYGDNKTNTQWHYPLDLEGKQDIEWNYKNCVSSQVNKCTQMDRGKFFACDVAGNIRNFNQYFGSKIPVTDKDYLDIYKVKSIKEIINFMNKPIPMCKYCNIKGRSFDNEWGISRKDISEWT